MHFKRPIRLLAAVLVVAASAAPADASTAKHGVKARVSHGTLVVAGNGKANKVTLRLRRGHPGTLRVDVGANGSPDFSFDRRRFTRIVLSGGGGNDALAVDEGHGVFTAKERTAIEGGAGSDAITGGVGPETLTGGPAGKDRLVVNGTDQADGIAIAAPARPRVDVTRNGATSSARGFERVDVQAKRGADRVAIGDLSGTPVRQTNLALGAADGQPDSVSLSGGSAADSIGVDGGVVSGLPSAVSIAQLEPGRDRLTIDGGDGADRIALQGSPAADSFDVTRANASVQVMRDGALAVETDRIETLDLDTGAGADSVVEEDLAGTAVTQLTLALGAGDGATDSVSVTGGDSADALAIGGDQSGAVSITGQPAVASITQAEPSDRLAVDGAGGADTVDASGLGAGTVALTLRGGAGDDSIDGSAGDDTIRSDPGDGSDTVEGRGGIDTAVMEGSNAADNLSASPDGPRVQLKRDPDGASVSADGAERVELVGEGGADVTTVTDLAGTAVTQIGVDEGVSGAGDGQRDEVAVSATHNADVVKVAGGGGSANVTGLAQIVSIIHAEPANDSLTVNARDGADNVDASGLSADSLALTIDGGPQTDTLLGSAGGDTFRWDPGDSSDTLDGGPGTDRLLFNGSGANENVSIAANGARLRFTRDVGGVTQDAGSVERVDFNAAAGEDTATVGDLTGTDVTQTNIDVGSDVQADDVFVLGTANPDGVSVAGDASTGTSVTGLHSAVSVTHADPSRDTLNVNTLAGADNVNASGLAAGAIQLGLNGGDDADTITGSAGDDLVVGGRGTDVASLGPGKDTFVWNPGDVNDTVNGDAGTDTLQFNGANIGENISLTANGSRARFTRDVANITMDLGGVEHVNFLALGGADTISVADLSGTDVAQTSIDLGATGGAGDAAADNVVVNGTGAADNVTVAGSAGSTSVSGLHSTVLVSHAEAANDRLTVNAGGGDDAVSASGLHADAIGLTLNGGENADVLTGGDGNDTLNGDNGDDVLIGGPGSDTLNGGTGSNVVIQ